MLIISLLEVLLLCLIMGNSQRVPFSISKTSKSPAATDFVEAMQRRITEARILHKIASQRQKLYADTSRKAVVFQPK